MDRADAKEAGRVQLMLRQPGLLIDVRYPWLVCTRDIEVNFAGRFGLIECKSYARWINTAPMPPKFQDQMLEQLYVHARGARTLSGVVPVFSL